jgi:hypothetical protein
LISNEKKKAMELRVLLSLLKEELVKALLIQNSLHLCPLKREIQFSYKISLQISRKPRS